jgi:hypothetical protein
MDAKIKLSDEAKANIKISEKQIKEGETISLYKIKKKLKLL